MTNYVTVTFSVQDAGQDAETGSVQVVPTSVVTLAGTTVVSQDPVTRAFSGGSASVTLFASDNAGTSPASGFWAYQVTLPGWPAPKFYLVNFANGSTQRFDNLSAVVALTTYGPAASTAWVGGQASEFVVPAVIALTDAATIAVDASLGNDFRVTLGGNRTMGVPSNVRDGQKITFQVTQDGTGNRTLTWPTGSSGDYSFGSGSAPTLSTTAGDTDLIGFVYNAAKARWLCLGSATGF